MRQYLAVAAAAVLSLTGVDARQPIDFRQPPPKPSQTPIFRSAVEVVHLDVSVLDRDGRPVRGLKPTDFTILEDGKPQAIAVFNAVHLPDPQPVTTPWMRDVAPDVRSNDSLNERRLFMILLDDATIQSDPAAIKTVRDAARGIVNRLGPADLAAVVFTRDNRHSQDYTSDRARLLAAIDRFSLGFRDMAPDIPVKTDILYFETSVGVLERAVAVLGNLPDRRKAIIYVGQGVPVDIFVGSAAPGLAGEAGAASVEVRGATLRIQTALQDLFRKAAHANVNIYTVDACGLRADPPPRQIPRCMPGDEVDYLIGVAAATGGRAVVNTNDFEPGLTRIFVENSSYYLLGYHPTNTKQDGKFRRLQVGVNRPGVQVRTRSGYEAEKASVAATRKAELEASPLGAALAGVLPKSDLPIQMSAVALPLPGKREAAVGLVFGVRQPIRQGQGRAIERVDLQVSAFDVDGRSFGSKRYRADVTIRAGANGLAEYEVLTRFDLKPGRYQLRVAANVASLTTSGSLYYDIDVPDFSATGASLSGMVLTATPGPEVAPRDALAAVLPVVPTARRTFTGVEQVAAFLRVHQGGKSALTPVAGRALLVDEKDMTIMDRSFTLSVDQFDNTRIANIRIDLPVSRLSHGEYLLSVETQGPKAMTRRQLRFRIARP